MAGASGYTIREPYGKVHEAVYKPAGVLSEGSAHPALWKLTMPVHILEQSVKDWGVAWEVSGDGLTIGGLK